MSRSIWDTFARRTRRAPQARRRTAGRLGLEILEDRTAPATLTVNSLADDTATTALELRQAINIIQSQSTAGLSAAQLAQVNTTVPLGTNDTIQFDPNLFTGGPGTITLASTLAIGRSFTLSGPGASTLTISGNNAVRIFNFNNLSTPSTVGISNVTLANGRAVGTTSPSAGGAIFSNGTVNIDTVTFNANQAGTATSTQGAQGGAIQSSGTLNVTNSTFTNNTATATMEVDGGAIYSNGPSVTITSSTFDGNTAAGTADATTGNAPVTNGGAIYAEGTLMVSGSLFTNNTASSTASATITGATSGAVFGGAIYSHNTTTAGGVLTAGTSLFEGNVATSSTALAQGGAITGDHTITLTSDSFVANAADDRGGAVVEGLGIAAAPASLTATGCLFVANATRTVGQGGAVAAFASLNLTGDYFVNNGGVNAAGNITYNNQGGSVYATNGGLTFGGGPLTQSITGTTIARSLSNQGGGVYITNAANFTISNSTLFNNIGFFVAGAVDVQSGKLNLFSDTITANLTAGSAAGIFDVSNVAMLITNSIIAGNSEGLLASQQRPSDVSGLVQAAATVTDPVTMMTTTVTSHNNLIGVSSGLIANDFTINPTTMQPVGFVDLTGQYGNLIGSPSSPIDPRLSNLRSNGGPLVGSSVADPTTGMPFQVGLPTVALEPDSPAVAAGATDPNLPTDQNGVTRSGTPNIGAIEYVASVVSQIVITVNGGNPVTSGTPFTIVVTAADQYGNAVDTYTGTVHFTLSGTMGQMVGANYTFTTADAGQHRFNLPQFPPALGADTYTLTGTDTSDPTITGSTTFMVM